MQSLLHMGHKKWPPRPRAPASAQGEIPTIMELPAPWGPKPYIKDEDSGYKPAKYPSDSSPLLDGPCAAA